MPPAVNTSKPTPAIIASIAGSDSFSGAGIQADLKTAHSLDTYCATIVTAVTAQNSKGVQNIQLIDVSNITAQLNSIHQDLGPQVKAIKIGMLGSAETALAVANYLRAHFDNTPIVLDTVMRATSGGSLSSDQANDVIIKQLIPMATLITPNLLEAAALLNTTVATNTKQMKEQATALIRLGAQAVLLKGGHLEGENATDILLANDQHLELQHKKIITQHTHGTGCTLSTAIAAGLAKGYPLTQACEKAKTYVTHALKESAHWHIVESNGPLNHKPSLYV